MSESRTDPARRRAAPYVSSLEQQPSGNVAAMEWAKYLGAEFGQTRSISALTYYRNVNWISEEVRRAMITYVRGLSLDEYEGDGEFELSESLESLEGTPFERHAISLRYIARIANDDIEMDLVPLRHPDEHTVRVDGSADS